MRRAGGNAEESASLPDETSFNAGEDVEDVQVEAGAQIQDGYRPAEPGAQLEAVEEAPRARGLMPRSRNISPEVIVPPLREDVQLIDVVRVLLSRWKLIAAIAIASLSLAITYNEMATPLYQARARLLIEPDAPQVVPFRPITEDTGRFDYFSTQLEVLRSRSLAKLTLEKLGLLDKDPEQQSFQIGSFLSSVNISPVKSATGDSRVVNVTYSSTNPQLAARYANGLAQAYVDQNVDVRRQKSRDASTWLKERLAELRQQVHTSEDALQTYRERKDAVSLDDQQNIVVQKLAQLNAAVTTARTDKVEKETLYQQLIALQQRGDALDTFPPILSNTFIQGLKADLATLQQERGELAQRFGELHPDMIKVETAIAAAEHRLNAEIAKIVGGVRNDFRTAEARERNLLAALETQKQEVLELSQQAIGYGALKRDASSTQQIYESVLQRIKETELSGELQVNNARILDAAQVPGGPVSPQTFVNVIIALFGGGIVAIGLALGVEYFYPRIVKPEDVSDALHLPLLGIAPRFARTHTRSLDGLPSEFQEALRDIRTRILLSPATATARTLAVTSTTSGEGKTAIASGLAASMAKAGRRVLLVDGDMRHPRLHRVFAIAASPGLANIMSGMTKPSEALFTTSVEGLYVLPAGDGVANPSELLDRDRLITLIQGFSQVFDLIVLDCPPLVALADVSIIANAASSVLFVVGAGTSREGARVAIERLTSVEANVIGVVLNKAKLDRLSAYHYPYYYENDGVARAYRG